LMFGASNKALQTSSTRQALREMCKLGHISKNLEHVLLDGYNFLKRVETALRLFDLKSADSFPVNADSNLSLSRAMGFGNNTAAFIEKYLNTTKIIRDNFSDLVGVPD
jgi:glutamine synthetase adenylyltransferase